MPEVQVSDRVFINHYKYKGDNELAVAAITGDKLTLRDTPEYYYTGIPLSAVVSVDSTLRLRREKFMKAFGELTSFGELTQTNVSNEVPGFIHYYKPDSEGINCIKLPEAKDNKELWIVISFNERFKLEVPATTEPKDIEIRHVRPFEIKTELAGPDGTIVGRDHDKELHALSDRLELILHSMVMQAFQPFKDTRAKCLEHIENYLGNAPAWVFDGDDMFDTIPEAPGLYLCGFNETGYIYRLSGTDKMCIYVDSRMSCVVKVTQA